MKRAWALISVAVWVAAFLGVWFIARELEARTGERFVLAPRAVASIVATIVGGSVAAFGFIVAGAADREDEDRRRGP